MKNTTEAKGEEDTMGWILLLASKDKDNFDTITNAFYVQREVTIQHTYPYVYRVKIPYCGWER